MFDRYFLLGIEGKLSEILFSKIRESPSKEFNKHITDLCSNKELVQEVLDRFQEIKEFDDKEDFEKIVKGIFHLANSPHPNPEAHHRSNQIRYNGASLSELLGNKQTLKNFYGDQEKYKEFLFPLLETTKPVYDYTNEFLNYLLHEGYYHLSHVTTPDEISELLLKNLKNAISNSTRFTLQLWWLFLKCEIRNEVPQSYNVSHIS